MKKENIIFVLLLFSLISGMPMGCKDSPQKKEVKEKLSYSDSIAASGKQAQPTAIPATHFKSYNLQGQRIVEFRMKQKPKNWAILDVGLWEYEFVYKDGAMSKPGAYNGHWIDFDEKNKYTYGIYSETTGSGIYHYDNDTHMLIMVDSNENKMPEEFELNLVQNMMIMMGRNTFGPNPVQCKLKKINQIPIKK